MKRYIFVLVLLGCGWSLSGVPVGGEEPAKTGSVKGSVTIHGTPAPEVVVSVEGLPVKWIRSRINPKPGSAHMDQRGMKFVPRVEPVLAGTTVNFPNNDNVWHNVFSRSEAKQFDLGLYPPGKSRGVTFDKPGVVRILCNVHPAMEAFIVVEEHPYFTVPDQRGNYELDGIPLGRYRLQVWHPELGGKEQPFNLVRESEVLAIDVELE